MKILLRNAEVFVPQYLGVHDILVENGIIVEIGKNIQHNCTVLDCGEKIVCPMFVDGHAHLLGNYYTEEGILCSGVGTMVGVLANEQSPACVSKLCNLAKRIEEEYKIKTYCLAGSKNFVENSSIYIRENENVVGVKTALFQPQRPKPNLSYEKLKEDAVRTYRAGVKSGKSVQLHIHLDHPFEQGKRVDISEINFGKLDNLHWIDQIVNETGVPYSLFKLTHAQKYYNRIFEYANKGCFIDYTAFSDGYDVRFDCLVEAINKGEVDLTKISISSDLGVMTMEKGNKGKETPISLLNTIQKLVLEKGISLEIVLPFITTNAGAQITRLGTLEAGKPCKLLVLDKNLNIQTIINHDLVISNEHNLLNRLN